MLSLNALSFNNACIQPIKALTTRRNKKLPLSHAFQKSNSQNSLFCGLHHLCYQENCVLKVSQVRQSVNSVCMCLHQFHSVIWSLHCPPLRRYNHVSQNPAVSTWI